MEQIDITGFCDKENSFLNEPFNLNNWTIASNGHMAIRVPLRDDVKRGIPQQITEEMILSLAWHKDGEETTKFTDYEPQKLKACKTCKGTGRSVVCRECDGEGVVEWNNSYHSYDAECRSCHGNGRTPDLDVFCADCDGTGKIPEDMYEHVDIGDVRLSKKLLEKIKNLPGVKLGKTVGVENHSVAFLFDGGDGILMCLNKDYC